MASSPMNHGSPSDRHSIWGIHALWEQLQGDLPDLSSEVVDRLDHIGGGQGGSWEDQGYQWYAGA